MARLELVRLAAALAALAAGAVAVAVAALVLHRTPGPVPLANASTPAAAPATSSPVASSPAGPAFPSPPAGAVVFSREDGPNALALAVVPHGSDVLAQASVVGQQGTGVDGLDVSFGSTRASACGPGCYRATIPRASTIDVHVGATRWAVAIPATAQDAAALVARATQTWRSLRSLVFFDRLGSDATDVVVSHWVVVAPDKLSYTIPRGPQGVIVGDRRWDRLTPTGKWVESPQSVPLKQPVPLWQSATDAHVIGRTKAAWRITFFDPRTPGWFAITVDRRTFRTLDARMITTAHFMHERYGPFDAPLAVRPPT